MVQHVQERIALLCVTIKLVSTASQVFACKSDMFRQTNKIKNFTLLYFSCPFTHYWDGTMCRKFIFKALLNKNNY